MAKKKKAAAPQRPCVDCGKLIHARKKVCDHCGAEQTFGATSRKKKVSRRKKDPSATSVNLAAVDAAADFIASMGGVNRAKEALSEAERLAKKLS